MTEMKPTYTADMGVNCPGCDVAITTANAGGYRTYCEGCCVSGEGYTMLHGDCLEIMPTLAAGSVDAVITDPPYGTTACKWDTIIPFDDMWTGIKHVRKPRAAVVLFGSEPFSSLLRVSNLKEYKYDWVWVKNRPSNLHHAKNMPMQKAENILAFSGASMGHDSLVDVRMNYYPQGVINTGKKKTVSAFFHGNHIGARNKQIGKTYDLYTKFPHNVLYFKKEETHIHPTQKPVALMEYLVKTYTNEGDTVLDFTMGSGSTGVAAVKLGRQFIGIEQDAEYFAMAAERITNAAGDFTTTEAEKAKGQIALWDI